MRVCVSCAGYSVYLPAQSEPKKSAQNFETLSGSLAIWESRDAKGSVAQGISFPFHPEGFWASADSLLSNPMKNKKIDMEETREGKDKRGFAETQSYKSKGKIS